MFYRELELPLDKIKSVLGSRDFDLIVGLAGHRRMLLEKKRRIGRLIGTIEKTIKNLEQKTMLKDEELYAGFSEKEVRQLKEYEKEAARMYDPDIVAQSQKRVRSMTGEKWRSVRAEGEKITRQLASLIDKDPASPEVQEVIARHYKHLGNFYTPTLGMYRGLGEMYVSDSCFRAHYDRYAKNLADFVRKAINAFCAKDE